MFLSQLLEVSKKNFLILAKHSMGLNGEFKDEELEIYTSFQHECDLPDYDPEVNKEGLAEAIESLSGRDITIRKVVMIELLGIMMADGVICDAEQEFVNQLSVSFDLEGYQIKRMKRWVSGMNDLVEEGYRIVGG
jgi:tellurite resistance protein